MPGTRPGIRLSTEIPRTIQCAAATAGAALGSSIAMMWLLTAFCTFSNARTSICRTRSRETPNSSASSSSVIGSSANRRASKMRRSRSLSTPSAWPSALCRFSDCSEFGEPAFLAGAVVDQPIHPFAQVAVLADRGIERRVAAEPAVHIDHVLLGNAQPFGDQLDLIRPHVTFVERGDAALRLSQIKEQLLLVGGGCPSLRATRNAGCIPKSRP